MVGLQNNGKAESNYKLNRYRFVSIYYLWKRLDFKNIKIVYFANAAVVNNIVINMISYVK